MNSIKWKAFLLWKIVTRINGNYLFAGIVAGSLYFVVFDVIEVLPISSLWIVGVWGWAFASPYTLCPKTLLAIGYLLTIASYIPTIVFNPWALNRHYIGNYNYGLWRTDENFVRIIMDYELCVKLSITPILSNICKIGKNWDKSISTF